MVKESISDASMQSSLDYLHLCSYETLLAVAAFFWVQELINDNIVRINVERSEFLDHSLSFIERQKFRDANANKCRQIGILELIVDFLNYSSHSLQFSCKIYA